MSDASLESQIAAATAYNEFFVPALFQEWAPRVVSTARIRSGHRVLDVACGTGVLAREVVSRVGSAGSVTGLDPNSGMLTVARRLTPEVEWRVGKAETMPFQDGSFDAVVSQFGLMFFSDRHQSLREMLRVLTPGGTIAVAVWDSLENTPAYATEVAVVEKIAGRQAADALRAPFILGDHKELATMFLGGGVADAAVTTHHGTGKFPNIRSMVEGDLRGWLPIMGVDLSEETIRRILEEAEGALRHYVTRDGSVEFDSPAHIVSGSKL